MTEKKLFHPEELIGEVFLHSISFVSLSKLIRKRTNMPLSDCINLSRAILFAYKAGVERGKVIR